MTSRTKQFGGDVPTAGRAEFHVSVRLWGPALTPFAVLYDEKRRALRSRTRAEIGRTETITHAGGGATRTFLRSFVVRASKNPTLRVALFDFVKSSMLIEDHVFIGAVTFSLSDVLPGGVGIFKVANSYSPQHQVVIVVRASRVDDELFNSRRNVILRIMVPEMRRKKIPHALVTQSFDISRSAPAVDSTSAPSWVPVYRSESASTSTSTDKHVRFEAAIVPEWRLYGSDTPLRIRLLQHSSRSVRVSVAAVCTTSLQELQELDASRDSLPMYCGRSTSTIIGRLFLTLAEPTECGGVFAFTAQYEQSSNAKRALSLSMTRITSMRSDRKTPDRRFEDRTFTAKEPQSVSSGRSLDRFSMRLRKKVTSESAWSNTSSAYQAQSGPRSEQRVPRWRSWLSS